MREDNRTLKQLDLERLSFVIRKRLPENVKIGFIEDYAEKGMLLELREDIWAEKLQDLTQVVTFQTSFPSTWWQHFKERFFSAWLLEKFPVQKTDIVRNTKVRFKRYALFPEFRHSSQRDTLPYVIQEFVEETKDVPYSDTQHP